MVHMRDVLAILYIAIGGGLVLSAATVKLSTMLKEPEIRR
jgi:hypothetical protein